MKEINKAIYFSFLIDILYNEEIYIKKISLLRIKATVELLLAIYYLQHTCSVLDISWVQCHLVVLQRLKQKIHELNSHALAAMFCYQFAHQLLQQRKIDSSAAKNGCGGK